MPEQPLEPMREVALGEAKAWGVFDAADIEAAEEPIPFATFDSETDARGWALLKAFLDTPVIRLCRVRGTVAVDVAPSGEPSP
ncbi:MAG: hypothetical protein JXB05_29195 [Myxococcaceae bacterium]|nr:hypothetical protein [Myxococcaceae bacterium]